MDRYQIALVQSSFTHVVPIADAAAVVFYDKLFEVEPGLRQRFPDDMREQRTNLIRVLTAAVKALTDREATGPVVQALSTRRTQYGVLASHFDDVGSALIGTLEVGLGEAFTPEVRAAWEACYRQIAMDMLEAVAMPPRAGLGRRW